MTNQEYISERNKLIPKAERVADNTIGSNGKAGEWNRAFSTEMNRLAFNKGLISKPVVYNLPIVESKVPYASY